MGIIDTIKGLLGGEAAQNVLESTGLGEHVEGFLGEGNAVAENFGVALGQASEALGIDSVAESLPGGLGDVIAGGGDGGPDTTTA